MKLIEELKKDYKPSVTDCFPNLRVDTTSCGPKLESKGYICDALEKKKEGVKKYCL